MTTIILDLNGTLSVNGKISNGVADRLKKLKELGYKIILFTGDQRGTADKLCAELEIEFRKAVSSEEKERFTLIQDTTKTVAIGNARIDIGTFKHSKVSIATLQSEGIHKEILEYVDLIVPSINDALDLLIDVNSFCASMRK